MEIPSTTTAYLNRHLEPYIEDEDIDLIFAQTFSRPLAEIEYAGSGRVELMAGGVIISYEYHEAASVPEKVSCSDPFGHVDDWRDLAGFTVVNTENGEVLDLDSLYPYEYRTTFRAWGEDYMQSYHWAGQRLVVMASGITTSRHIVGLMHEVGHAAGHNLYPHLYDDSALTLLLNDASSPEAQQIRLMQERNAWAYAIDVMRPFASNDPTSPFYYKAIMEFVHKEFLQSYSNRIIEKQQEAEGQIRAMAA